MDENRYKAKLLVEVDEEYLELIEKEDLVPVFVPRDALNVSTLKSRIPVIFDAEKGILSIRIDKEAVSQLLASQNATQIAENDKQEDKKTA